jgi:formate--tetrahydrofolate ligase
MKKDIEIAQSREPILIKEIAERLNIDPNDLMVYGKYKAKVNIDAIERSKRPEGQGLAKLGKKVSLALREPSMGPLFGVKGGATGGGYSQVIPMADINLHFNGDFHAISSAHNLLAAALDNAIHFRKIPKLDPRRIIFPRVMDMNDRSLRRVIVGLGGNKMGVPRESYFDITSASEVMAILALSNNLTELKERLSRILVGLTYEGEPITAESLQVAGAMTAVLKDAIHPNLVQTLEGVPAFIHCGPFANIAHGSNSILATRLALAYSDYVVTEAGFGFDLGAEKFFDITCRDGNYAPELCVLVVTIRALKMHGKVKRRDLKEKNPKAVQKGLANMEKHIENIHKFQVPVVVAINQFADDTAEEIKVVLDRCEMLKVQAVVADIFAKGGEGGKELASKVVEKICDGCQMPLKPLYKPEWTPEKKIETIAKEIYGAKHVDYTADGKRDLKTVYKLGYDKLKVCMAKTPRSLSDNPKLLGRPEHFIVTVKKIEIAAGAGFIVPLTGDVLRMPGLPSNPAYLDINVNPKGKITGLS